jgi:hypothetical protein
LVTALNLDIGPRIWWPSKLGREPDVPAAEAPQLVLAGARAANGSNGRNVS